MDVLEKRRKTLSAEDPDTIIAAANLASTSRTQGHLHETGQLEVCTTQKATVPLDWKMSLSLRCLIGILDGTIDLFLGPAHPSLLRRFMAPLQPILFALIDVKTVNTAVK